MTIDTAFTDFPNLTTSRLLLRAVNPGDAGALFALKSNPDVTPRYGQEPHHSVEDTLGWIHRLEEYYAQRDALFWAVTLREKDWVIGGCTFWNFEPGYHCTELGYELHPDYWRQGIAAEAVAALLEYGFTDLGLNRVEACPLAGNKPSQDFLLKLGFSYEGTLRKRVLFRGAYTDLVYYGLLREEWLKSSNRPDPRDYSPASPS